MSTPSIPTSAVGMDASDRRVNGLDSIRFICAFVVVLGHLGLTAVRVHHDDAHGIQKLAIGIFNSLFNGPAAVIIFFLISGFCIHFPYKGSRPFSLPEFYSRRFIRIGLPALAYILVGSLLQHSVIFPQHSVLWSVVCECIYYLLYPAILFLRRKYNWLALGAASTVAAALVIAIHLHSLNDGSWSYGALGSLTWIIGLPCWILGCWLAENYASFRVPSTSRIWLWRGGIYALAIFLNLFRFHVNSFIASSCILLDLFCIVACFWLGNEIAYGSVHKRATVLEWAGSWSYSLYLFHGLTEPLILLLGFPILLNPRLHLVMLLLAVVGSYVFFRIIERPSHLLAVAVGRAIRKGQESSAQISELEPVIVKLSA